MEAYKQSMMWVLFYYWGDIWQDDRGSSCGELYDKRKCFTNSGIAMSGIPSGGGKQQFNDTGNMTSWSQEFISLCMFASKAWMWAWHSK